MIANEVIKLFFLLGVKCLFSLTMVWGAKSWDFFRLTIAAFKGSFHFVAAFFLLVFSTVQDFILHLFRTPHYSLGPE